MMNNDQKTRDRLKESEATKYDHDDTGPERDESDLTLLLIRGLICCALTIHYRVEMLSRPEVGDKNAFKTWTMVLARLVL